MISKQKRKCLVMDLSAMILLILLDQYTKYLAVIHLKDQPAFNIINGVLELNYLENKGAAFDMLQNQKIFFIFVAVIILGVIAYILYKTPDGKKYNIMHILLTMIAAGAIGNMIDRIRLDYVVDFIYFVLINFPIFNLADIYVSIATVILILVLLFYYKEKDLEFISFKQKKYRELK
ncbi:MAG: signal peptidase II [Lachnospiraceae bacterium]|nr:signal peptidase II [Lachnospiraceae bacterium]